MCTDGVLLLLQAAQLLESPPYSEISESSSSSSSLSIDETSELQGKLDLLLEQIMSTKSKLKGIESTLMMNSENKIPIGTGRTGIPKNIYHSVNWSSYTNATRKLLTAVFCRTELATHSLTGKPSNAFGNTKPIKKKLNPMKVNDIIKEVTLKCKVNKSLVRTVITTKCAEESRRHRVNGKYSLFTNM